MKTLEELESELKQIRENKIKYRESEMWEWCSKLRDQEKQIIKEISLLQNNSGISKDE